MRITVIGGGIVGKATSRGFLSKGHDVWIVEQYAEKRKELEREFPQVSSSIKVADIYFICTHERDVEKALRELETWTEGLWVIRSTVPVGKTGELMKKFNRCICHNPEFLRQDYALEDFLYPSRIVIGECCKEHGNLLERVYIPFDSEVIRTTSTTSELAKLACNASLTSSISFWNAIKKVADRMGVDYEDVFKIASLDKRIPRYGLTRCGPYGGSCLEKDLDSLIELIESTSSMRIETRLLEAIRRINNDLKQEANK